jgi:hypothetical protein
MFMTHEVKVIEYEKLLPIAPILVENLVTLAKAFADAALVKITTVGTNSTKTASFYVDLEEGRTSCTLRKYDILTAWFSENWPEGHVMPKLKDPRHYPTAEGTTRQISATKKRSKPKRRGSNARKLAGGLP